MLTMTKIDDIRKAFFEEGISISEILHTPRQIEHFDRVS